MDEIAVSLQLSSFEIEKQALICLIHEAELIQTTSLKREHFHDEKNKNLFSTLLKLDEEAIMPNMATIIERVGTDRLEKIGGFDYLGFLQSSDPITVNFPYFENTILSYFKKRKAYEIAQELVRDITSEDIDEIKQRAVDELIAIDEEDADTDDGDIKRDIEEHYDYVQTERGDITGAPLGFTELDKMTYGLQKQDFIIVGARPSVGKTAFALNGCTNYALEHKGISAIFSLEMPKKSLIDRMCCAIGNIDASRMKNPKKTFSDDDWNKYYYASGMIYASDIKIFDKPTQNMPYIRKKCRMLKRKYPDQHILVMIDYLQLIQGDPKFGGNRMAEISDISRKLKALARELDITVVALSQLSRGVESRQDKRPMMSDLRESGQIEQDADVIMFLYREDYYDRETEARGTIEIIIAKQRNGPVGSAQLAFVKEFNKFVNLETRFDK